MPSVTIFTTSFLSSKIVWPCLLFLHAPFYALHVDLQPCSLNGSELSNVDKLFSCTLKCKVNRLPSTAFHRAEIGILQCPRPITVSVNETITHSRHRSSISKHSWVRLAALVVQFKTPTRTWGYYIHSKEVHVGVIHWKNIKDVSLGYNLKYNNSIITWKSYRRRRHLSRIPFPRFINT